MTIDWQDWSREAQRLMQRRNEEWRARYGLSSEPYHWDMDSAQLSFQGADDVLVADITLVGSLSRTSNTFLWGWADHHAPEPVTRRIGRVREFGEANDLSLLVDEIFEADHAQALELAVIAGRVLDAAGVFIDKSGDVTVYFLLFDFRLQGGSGG